MDEPGGSPMAGPGGMPPTPPSLPKSPAGGPSGPGASPMLSPGPGAGAKAAATAQVKAVIPSLLQASMAYDAGSKEQQALLRAISSLNPIFGKAEGPNMVPSALVAMAQSAKQGPLSAGPPPGMMRPGNENEPPMPGGGAPGGGLAA